MNDKVATPESIRQFREKWGLSQPRLAQALGLSPQTVSRWERDAQVIANPRLVYLALKGLEADLRAHGRRHIAA